jgi:hypothetical protein
LRLTAHPGRERSWYGACTHEIIMRAVVSMIVAISMSACAPAPTRTPAATEPVALGTTCTHVGGVSSEARHPDVAPPYEAQRLVDAVARLASGTLDREHYVIALERLADSVAIVAPTQVADVDRIRSAAEDLKHPRTPNVIGDNPIHIALVAALDALASTEPFYTHDVERFRHQLAMLATAVESVPPESQWRSQADHQVGALRQAIRTIYAGVGAPPPLEPATTVGMP